MKVNVSITVDIDPDAWAQEYGVDRDEVRADVKRYVRNAMQDHLRGEGMLVEDGN